MKKLTPDESYARIRRMEKEGYSFYRVTDKDGNVIIMRRHGAKPDHQVELGRRRKR